VAVVCCIYVSNRKLSVLLGKPVIETRGYFRFHSLGLPDCATAQCDMNLFLCSIVVANYTCRETELIIHLPWRYNVRVTYLARAGLRGHGFMV